MREDLANDQGQLHLNDRAPEVIERILEVKPRLEDGVLPRDPFAAPIGGE